MRKIFKYLLALFFKADKTLDIAEIKDLKLICILNVMYLKAHINTTSALMNSYPARSIKRKNMVKHLEKLALQLKEQENDVAFYRRAEQVQVEI